MHFETRNLIIFVTDNEQNPDIPIIPQLKKKRNKRFSGFWNWINRIIIILQF